MGIFEDIFSYINKIVQESHTVLITIPLIAIAIAFGLGFFTFAYSIIIKANIDKPWIKRYKINAAVILLDKFEWIAFFAILITQIGMAFAMASGIFAAGTFEEAINDNLLEINFRFYIYSFIFLLTPIFLKLYFEIKLKKDIFQDSPRVVPILYLIPQLIALVLLIISAQAGIEYSSI